MTHTKGPWYRLPWKDQVFVEDKSGNQIAICNYNIDFDSRAEVQANARLIAAAPDMLEALMKIRSKTKCATSWKLAVDTLARFEKDEDDE